MRGTINPPSSPLRAIGADGESSASDKPSPYDAVTDPAKLRRLVTAREKTRAALEAKAAWSGMEQSLGSATAGAE